MDNATHEGLTLNQRWGRLLVSTRVKHVLLVLLAQTGCLGVGLWMQHHYVVSSTVEAAKQQAWSAIEAGADEVLSELDALTPATLAGADGAFEKVTRWLATHHPDSGEVMLVDPQWRVVFPRDDMGPAFALSASRGPPVEWIPNTDVSAEAVAVQRGGLILSDGLHIAVAYTLKHGLGRVLIHQPVAAIEAGSAALTQSLPAISVMTFVWICALSGIAGYIILARLHDEIARERSRSASDALRKTQNLLRTRNAVIFGLAKLAESRDPETGDHLERISVYSTSLASAVRHHPNFRDEITPGFVRLIGISSALHDIGKVGVEDRILLKPGPLTSEEHASMQNHAEIGGECLREIEQRLGGSNFLQMAREIAFAHHEKWDGSGYPKGLAGTAIPLSARIVAIADMYDALSTKRVYKERFPHEECVATIKNEMGKKFDPVLVDVWLTIESKFRSIARQYTTGTPGDLMQASVGLEALEDTSGAGDDLYAVPSGAWGARI
ncbi:MAG: HD domain-containing phosphohydrolase [Phycisphaerae bacterium]